MIGFAGARQNLERGERASVEPNLTVLRAELERSPRPLCTHARNLDHLRQELAARLPDASPEEIAIGARLLAW